ncbi:MAG TPA: NUDIX hydrolase [Phnomibacter sp.]|nr:NUDIX hydrolase [Phnomibacter sp.]
MSALKVWERISSRYLHVEKWFKFRADKVLKGNGEIMEPYYVLEFSNWVNVLPITREGKVILVRQYRYAMGTFSIEVPGGIMDPHETDPLDAAKRELLEETGYSCGKIEQVAVVAANPATQTNSLYCYLATDCELTHALDHDEHEEMEVLLVDMDELLTLLRENKIVQSLHVNSILYGLMKLGKIQF